MTHTSERGTEAWWTETGAEEWAWADAIVAAIEAPPNFAKLAEAVNGYGEQVTELSQFAPALQRGLEHTRNHTLAVIAVRVLGPMQGVGGRG